MCKNFISYVYPGTVSLKNPAYGKLRGGGILYIGQEQDTLGGSFEVDQSFCGWVAEFNIWSKILDETEI